MKSSLLVGLLGSYYLDKLLVTKLLNKHICLYVYLQTLDSFCKFLNSMAWLIFSANNKFLSLAQNSVGRRKL